MRSKIYAVLLITMILILSVPVGISAQDPDGCSGGACTDAGTGSRASEEVQGLGGYRVYGLRGGYVAAGTGMRNRGWGRIWLYGIPRGARVFKAFLYWSIVDQYQWTSHQWGNFAGKWIKGDYIGADHQPCWTTDDRSAYSYRADVTSLVKGNGTYSLWGFKSGQTDGADPWSSGSTPPLLEGASLVVLFEKSWYPWTRIAIWDGAATLRSGVAENAYIQVGGFTATNPVGPAYTTFVLADGQSSGVGVTGKVNGNTIPGLVLTGNDPMAGGAYTYGSLWDTDTASVGRYINPGNTSVRLEVDRAGSGDCVTWVAQVFSISDGRLDTDGDALLDGWEANGHNGIDLPAMGASPWHKDIFVENDWMTVDAVHNHQPSFTVLNNVRDAFAAAPLPNPDGSWGIRLHNDRGQAPYGGGNQVPHQNDISAGCTSANIWAGFDAIKNVHFNPNRADIFHYVIWAHDICPGLGSTSGISRGIPASDYIVSLGSWSGYGSTDARTGTHMHELGHNLGLFHGGNVGDNNNYKPNHLSIMNYAFQVIGVPRNTPNRRVWDYTRMTINALDENNLNEFAGLGGSASLATYGTRWYTPTTRDDWTADTNVDWNWNSVIQASVAQDINNNGSRTVLGTVRNQWSNLTYNGGSIGLGVRAPMLLTPEQFELYPCLDANGLGAVPGLDGQ